MKFFKEITEWSGEWKGRVPQHVYIFTDDRKLIGYIKEGTTERILFKTPSKQWDNRGRKFVEVTNEYI